ncbi:uncharacterized protein LOC124447327 [Xenia sp. Carnegie-2017]|uniref:uncharacterized protein LOC124447327 n=1 Tax=Xenia sp. Carnegie-2017 TaxID=2897299 RepID=UPI001F03863E|nr:uncharacterized protein LOC124447327 [Xenia sp. Carnegie-2017]
MLNILISDAHNRLRIYRRKLNQHRETVTNHITQTDAKSINETIKETTNAYRTKRHNELQRKLQKSRSFKEINTDTHSWVKNISSKPLTVQQTKILSKGLNYNIKDADKLDFVADLESSLKLTNLNDEIKEDIRHKVTTNLCLKRPVTLNNEEQKAIRNLRNDEDIVILPADKGRKTVIMDKSDYINKATTLLQDTNTYEPLQTDPNKTTTNRINKKLKQLKDKKKLNETVYKRIRPNDSSTAKFYGLPKIHKENNPLRPIVSLPGSPTAIVIFIDFDGA